MLGAEAFPALSAATSQDLLASNGGFASPESMAALANKTAGLKSTFHVPNS